MSERTMRLRARFLDAPREVDIERAVAVTEAHRHYLDKSASVRRSLILRDILSTKSVIIRNDELIVGNHGSRIRSVPLFPEYAVDWILSQMDTFPTRRGDQFAITEEQKAILREKLPYWQGRCLRDQIKGAAPPELLAVLSHGVFRNENYTMSAPGHMSPDYATLLDRGFESLRTECEERRDALDISSPDYFRHYDFYSGCIIACEAVIDFAGRYADEAERLAAKTRDPGRKRELQTIAENCRHVPANRPETFHQALQFVYFVQLIMQLEGNGLAIALGRLDQILYPFYQVDRSFGRLDQEQALELLETFYLKINEIDKIYSNEATRFLQGPGHGQCITLGGVGPDGRDAGNELTVLLLETDHRIRLAQPDIALRINPDISEEVLMPAVRNIHKGLNKIKIFNDEVIVRSMEGIGATTTDARDHCFLGCSEPVMSGKTNSWGNSGHVNLAKCLELALNDGRCMLTGTQMGPQTGDPTGFTGLDDVLEAFRTQLSYFVHQLVAWDNLLDYHHAHFAPLPFYSLTIDSCIERGLDFNAGGAKYNTTSPLGVGPITAGDSLAALKKLVFEEKRLSMEEVVEGLRSDFADTEKIRLTLEKKAPKFGNDEDYVDALCNEVLLAFVDELSKYTNYRGGPYIAGLYYLSANIPFGRDTAATPNGRRAGEPLNDGGISPSHGADVKGATAVAKSVGKLDHVRVPHGSVLNQRFHPSIFEGEGKEKLFGDYIRGYITLGGWESQFNVVTNETLRAAQKDPHSYRDLVVRVAGYSAFFTQLEPELQEDIIQRTEQEKL
jgi:pyruvate formate-lyase/glycerol dehydratase family glycyl radical enzyme